MKKRVGGWRHLAAVGVMLVAGMTFPAAGADVKVVKIEGIAGLQFDPPRFAVEPGQRVRMEFVNSDTMQHNLLIGKPGTRETLARMAADLLGEGAAKEYVPETDKVLLASRVLLRGESQTLEFTAPAEEDVYPYVCTFPGHATVMYGAMHVTTGEMPPLAEDPDVPGQIRLAAGGDETPEPTGHTHAEDREDMLEHVTIPDGLSALTFAQPRDISYPTALAPASDGVVYVGVDPNSSLGRTEGKGAIVRAEDSSGDGVADSFSTFAEIETVRGLVWDGKSLYVLHPPHISVFRDTTGDGVADESEILVRNIGYGIEHPRGGDHTTNGLRMGIDGWLYIAVGDFGFERAVGTDGSEQHLLGGGVARVRPDGSELELVATGLRNIYDIAISPALEMFARDNDNDGDGWDTRLFHLIDGADYGYPQRFTNFTDEILPPIVHYGQGSPTGAFYLDEPGWPEEYNDRLYTAEWNLNAVDRHDLSQEGASYSEAGKEAFLRIPSPTAITTDMDSTLYVASWHRGGFNYSGSDVGFVIGLRPEGHEPAPAVDFDEVGDERLIAELGGDSQTRRLMVQQAILRRGNNPVLVNGLTQLVNDSNAHINVRIAALFTLKQLLGSASHGVLIHASRDEDLRGVALRALADRAGEVENVPADLFVAGLSDADPRVRLQAAIGIGRLNQPTLAEELTRLLHDEDPAVAHASLRSLIQLEAADAVFAVLDAGDEALLDGARQVLQELHTNDVVDGLIARLSTEQSEKARQATVGALARLYHKEWKDWDGKADWWGTMPDRRGPYHWPTEWERTEDIHAALHVLLETEDVDFADSLAALMVRNRINVHDTDPLKVLMVTGGGYHDYDNQKRILDSGLSSRANLQFTIDDEAGGESDVKIARHENDDWAKEFDLVLYNMCFSGVSDTDWTDRIIDAHIEHGVPAMVVHCAIHSYSFQGEAKRWDAFMGVRSDRHQSQKPFTVDVLEPDHPILANFVDGWRTPAGELYEIVEVMPTATPLAHSFGEDSGEHHVNIWVNEYEGVRVFGTTIGHHNITMESGIYQNLLVNGLLWAVEKLRDDGKPEHGYARSRYGEFTPPPAYYEPDPEQKLTGEIIGTEGAWGDGDRTKEQAMDGDERTFFDGPTDSGSWVGLDLGDRRQITAVRFAPRRGFAGRSIGGRFQGANDASFSDAVDLYTIQAGEAAVVGRQVDSDESFRYVRYLGPEEGFGNISVIEFYGK